MQAYQNRPKELGGLQLVNLDVPRPNKNHVLVKVLAIGLNYRDLRMVEGTYTFNFKPDTIIGADCCGEIIEIGSEVEKDWIGKIVIINPNVNWGDDYDIPSNDFSILGTPNNGVFSEYISIHKDRIAVKPEHLSIEEAAAIPLTGITSYRAVFTKADVQPNQNILITGVSGGVAQFALLLCIAIGANTWVTTSDNNKLSLAINLGAKGGVNYTEQNIGNYFADEKIKFDAIIDCAGGKQINELLMILKPMGRLVLYGAMNGKTDSFDLFTLYYNQLKVLGTLIGNDIEFEKMIEFVNTHEIIPVVDSVFDFIEIDKAFMKLKTRSHYGKIVLKMKT